MLESLGVGIDLTPVDAARSLDILGITFLFAPNYHGALRHAVGLRRELGIRIGVQRSARSRTRPAPRASCSAMYSDTLVRPIAEVLHRSAASARWSCTAATAWTS